MKLSNNNANRPIPTSERRCTNAIWRASARKVDKEMRYVSFSMVLWDVLDRIARRGKRNTG